MSFRSDIDEDFDRQEKDKIARNKIANHIESFVGDMTDDQRRRVDQIRNPDDYDDWGFPRRFR